MSQYEPSAQLMKKILKLDGRKVQVPFGNIENQKERVSKLEELIKKENNL